MNIYFLLHFFVLTAGEVSIISNNATFEKVRKILIFLDKDLIIILLHFFKTLVPSNEEVLRNIFFFPHVEKYFYLFQQWLRCVTIQITSFHIW